MTGYNLKVSVKKNEITLDGAIALCRKTSGMENSKTYAWLMRRKAAAPVVAETKVSKPVVFFKFVNKKKRAKTVKSAAK